MELIRDSIAVDVAQVQEIYAHHVLHGLASFEETPPDVAEIAKRRESVLALGLPYIVAEAEGKVLGYAYATLYRTRSAYRHTLEDSVYVREGLAGRGIGLALLTELIARCSNGPWRQMVAVIGDSANQGSIRVHETCGFRHTGVMKEVGLKFDRWLDVVIMQLEL